MGSATIITVFNHKGGVGKTTTSVNLAAALCLGYGVRCLVVDMDPQANATRSLLAKETALIQPTMGNTLSDAGAGNATIQSIAVSTSVPGLRLAPSALCLSEAEFKLTARNRREFILRERLCPVADGYDYIIIDCAPSLGLLTLNALVAAQGVIVPCETQFLSLRGLRYVLDVLELIRTRLNPGLKVLGVLPTKFYVLSTANNEALACMRRLNTVRVFNAVIPRDVKAEEAPSHGTPVVAYAPESRAAREYRTFTAEVKHLCQQENQN